MTVAGVERGDGWREPWRLHDHGSRSRRDGVCPGAEPFGDISRPERFAGRPVQRRNPRSDTAVDGGRTRREREANPGRFPAFRSGLFVVADEYATLRVEHA